MQAAAAVGWLAELGLSERDLRDLNPCVPGEFTLPETYYVNSGSPHVVYRGTSEGTLPLVTGRWYLIPSRMVDNHPDICRDTVPLAQAPRLIH
jgi:hypothetical protein